MKRMLKSVSIMMACMLLMAGCNAGGTGNIGSTVDATGNTDTASSTAPSASSNDRKIIRFENHGANKHELFAEAAQIFNDSQDEIYVEFQTNTTDWEASLWAALAVDDAPDIITHIAGANIARYVDAGHLLDLSDLECSAFIDPVDAPKVSYDGGIYGIPVQTEIYGVFYNKDIFDRAGITDLPKTLDELEVVIEQLKPLETEDIYPFSTQYRDSGQLGMNVTYGAAASLYKSLEELGISGKQTSVGEYTFDNDRMADVLRLMALIRDNCQPRPEDTDYTTHNTYFANEESAMLIMGNWIIFQTRELNPEINMGMFPLPVSNDPADAVFAMDYNLVINVNAHSKNLAAADSFLTSFCDSSQPTSEFFVKNALPSGLIGFDGIVEYDPSLELPLAAKESSEFFTRVLPVGFDLGKGLQEYMMDKNMTVEQGIEIIQNNYDQHVSTMD